MNQHGNDLPSHELAFWARTITRLMDYNKKESSLYARFTGDVREDHSVFRGDYASQGIGPLRAKKSNELPAIAATLGQSHFIYRFAHLPQLDKNKLGGTVKKDIEDLEKLRLEYIEAVAATDKEKPNYLLLPVETRQEFDEKVQVLWERITTQLHQYDTVPLLLDGNPVTVSNHKSIVPGITTPSDTSLGEFLFVMQLAQTALTGRNRNPDRLAANMQATIGVTHQIINTTNQILATHESTEIRESYERHCRESCAKIHALMHACATELQIWNVAGDTDQYLDSDDAPKISNYSAITATLQHIGVSPYPEAITNPIHCAILLESIIENPNMNGKYSIAQPLKEVRNLCLANDKCDIPSLNENTVDKALQALRSITNADSLLRTQIALVSNFLEREKGLPTNTDGKGELSIRTR